MKKDRKVILSTIWLVVLLNYLYCDIVSLMDPNMLAKFLTGDIGSFQMTQSFLLGASIIMQIPIALILLSRVLSYRANRLANILGGIIMTVVQFSSLFAGDFPTTYYIFFSIIEISGTIFIVGYAWTWKRPDNTIK
jgi:hypothetical protein